MNKNEFLALSQQGYNKIPLMREALADLDTPLSVFLKLAAKPNSYLFESVQGGEKWGRYSIIGLPCETRIEVRGHEITLRDRDQGPQTLNSDDPLQWIENYYEQIKVAPVDGLPGFTGGLVGYFGYDTVRYVENRLAGHENPDTLGTPDILLMLSEEVVVFDNLKGELFFIVLAEAGDENDYQQAQMRLDELAAQIRKDCSDYREINESAVTIREEDFVSEFKQDDYKAAVGRIKEYIRAGDAMQVVLAQRMSIPLKVSALDVYRVLRSLNPSPYMFYIDLGDFQIVGSSPEILTRVEDGIITVRPIAGTRPRGRNEAEDKALEAELLADPKELAEHLMLIDLGRNDAGRVSEIGSVKLTEKMIVERYSHVMHIVSNVTGKLDSKFNLMDALRATFPAGTVSGAPKVRAMEIIDELEPVKRGIYSGAVGYLSWTGNMDTAIALRTAVVKDNRLYIQAGAGIVADSDPEMEWQETMNKGRAMFRAVALAESGLQGGQK
jgi:anthranilate synthase component 1